MDTKSRKKSVDALFEVYPTIRRLMYNAFDDLDPELTRTQQIILLALSAKDNLSMSQLANSICTSNEQATRAVTQLVDKGFVERTQNKTNRRVVNITLTEKARAYIEVAKKHLISNTDEAADKVSDEQSKMLLDSLSIIAKLFKGIE